MSPDRLRELLRQRALVQEHLAWLDREIADASGSALPAPLAPPVAVPSPLPVVLPPGPVAPPPAPAFPAGNASGQNLVAAAVVATTVVPNTDPTGAESASEEILEQYRVPSRNLQQDVRKGCFLYFVAAFALFALGVAVLYFAISSR